MTGISLLAYVASMCVTLNSELVMLKDERMLDMTFAPVYIYIYKMCLCIQPQITFGTNRKAALATILH